MTDRGNGWENALHKLEGKSWLETRSEHSIESKKRVPFARELVRDQRVPSDSRDVALLNGLDEGHLKTIT
jgi:hypothetical protein